MEIMLPQSITQGKNRTCEPGKNVKGLWMVGGPVPGTQKRKKTKNCSILWKNI